MTKIILCKTFNPVDNNFYFEQSFKSLQKCLIIFETNESQGSNQQPFDLKVNELTTGLFGRVFRVK